MEIIWRSYGLRFAFVYKCDGKYWFRIANTMNPLGKIVEYSKPVADITDDDDVVMAKIREQYKEKFDATDEDFDVCSIAPDWADDGRNA